MRLPVRIGRQPIHAHDGANKEIDAVGQEGPVDGIQGGGGGANNCNVALKEKVRRKVTPSA